MDRHRSAMLRIQDTMEHIGPVTAGPERRENVKKLYLIGMLVLLLATAPGLVWANEGHDLATVRSATAKYHRFELAMEEGWVDPFGCIESAGQGAMGFHYLKLDRFDDQLDLSEPEVLIYEKGPQGQMKLVAVEFIIPAAEWSDNEPPTFLGQTLQYKTTVGPYDVDPYYELHVWVWRHNPSGMFADWNPEVSCGTAG